MLLLVLVPPTRGPGPWGLREDQPQAWPFLSQTTASTQKGRKDSRNHYWRQNEPHHGNQGLAILHQHPLMVGTAELTNGEPLEGREPEAWETSISVYLGK